MRDKPNSIKLSNGLTVILYPMQDAHSVSFYVGVHAGARYETNEQAGLAHFLEHMLFEGTSKYKDSKELAEYLENIGGTSSAFTEKEYVTYNVKVLPKYFETGLKYLMDILFNSTLPAEAIEKEKGIVLEEINRKIDDPEIEIFEEWLLLVFGKDSRIGQSTLGTKSNIKDISKSELQDYLQRFYHPSNLAICVAGNFSEEQRDFLLDELSTLKDFGIQNSFDLIADIPLKEHLHITRIQAQQVQYNFGFVTNINYTHPDHYAFQLLGDILGGGTSARIFHKLVYDLGIAYTSYTYTWLFKDIGLLLSSGGLSEENIESAFTNINLVLSDIKRQGINPLELERSKQRMKANLYFSLETSDNVAYRYLLQQITEGKTTSLSEMEANIDNVTPEQVQKIAQEQLTFNNLFVLLRGPLSEKKRNIFEKQLKEHFS